MFSKRTNWNLAKNRLSEALDRHRASGKPLLDLTASNPTECGFVYDEAAILRALADPAALRYEPHPKGLLAAREAVAAYYAERDERGIAVSPDDIHLTTSTSEAYSFVFCLLCDPGDEMLIPSPSYPLFDFLADIQDVKLARYPLVYDHGWEIDFASLERAITPRTRGIVVVNPNNPTGHFIGEKDLSRLNEICSARNLAIVADEVFLDFGPAQRRVQCLATNVEALTFTTSGLSKICGLPQMKVAWVVTSGPERERTAALARLEIIADTYLSLNTAAQAATPEFLRGRKSIQEQLLTRLGQNKKELDEQLSQNELCTRLALEGGWYAVLRVPATRSDEDFALALLESHGVYVHPGHFYDFPGDGNIVVSLITPLKIFAEGMKRLLGAARD
ncbi:MAG TPA: pyridoxal phosphate-dependent aminotransferase [Candidatus Acidoferrales bacterium]|nr:pyridoxal phosphate-dependent aminotransferase [Candidatus Acidoferrales bacterium]